MTNYTALILFGPSILYINYAFCNYWFWQPRKLSAQKITVDEFLFYGVAGN